jgi:hypothetical protein
VQTFRFAVITKAEESMKRSGTTKSTKVTKITKRISSVQNSFVFFVALVSFLF